MSDDHRLLNLSDKDIFLLKIFEAVVKAGGYTAAEACLNKSKSAISIHVSALEVRLGKTLCKRGRAGFHLTPEGDQVYQICKELFADIDDYRERLNRVSPFVGGALKVVIDDTIYSKLHLLEGVLNKFNTGPDSVFLEISIASPERLLQMLLDGETDIGIGAIPREVADTEMSVLYSEDLALYCGDTHPIFKSTKSHFSSEDLKVVDAVDFWAYQSPEVEKDMEALHATARSSQPMARLILILSGKWIGLLPRDFAACWVASGRLKEIPRAKTSVKQKCYLAVRSAVASTSLCRQMAHELKQAFNSDRTDVETSAAKVVPIFG